MGREVRPGTGRGMRSHVTWSSHRRPRAGPSAVPHALKGPGAVAGPEVALEPHYSTLSTLLRYMLDLARPDTRWP